MAEKKKKNAAGEKRSLRYKGKPLVRKGNEVYYGNMSEKYVVMLMIKNSKKHGNLKLAEDITVQLMLTDPEIRLQDRVIKKSEKKGFFPALDIAQIWLERALRE